MKQTLVRLAGIALFVAGFGGLCACIIGLVALLGVHERLQPVLPEQVELSDRTLAATARDLALVEYP